MQWTNWNSKHISERELDILNWAYQSHPSQFWPICIKFDFAFSNTVWIPVCSLHKCTRYFFIISRTLCPCRKKIPVIFDWPRAKSHINIRNCTCHIWQYGTWGNLMPKIWRVPIFAKMALWVPKGLTCQMVSLGHLAPPPTTPLPPLLLQFVVQQSHKKGPQWPQPKNVFLRPWNGV